MYLKMSSAKCCPFSGRHENFYQLVGIEILATFVYIACIYNEILTCLNHIFTRLGQVDVDFFLPLPFCFSLYVLS